jgi:hypothetical protein
MYGTRRRSTKLSFCLQASRSCWRLLTVIPSRHAERVARAQLDSSKHLARIVEMLEQQQNASLVATEPAKPRRSRSRIVALILFALVVAHVGRWRGNRGERPPIAKL